MGDVGRHENLLKAVRKKDLKGIRSALGKEGSEEFRRNLVTALKQAYTNVNTVIQRTNFDGNFDSPEIKENRQLFQNLLKIAAKDGIDLDKSKNEIIDRLERDLAVFRKSKRTMDTKEHPLYKMGMKFVEYDERMEKRAKKHQSQNITPTATPKVANVNRGRRL